MAGLGEPIACDRVPQLMFWGVSPCLEAGGGSFVKETESEISGCGTVGPWAEAIVSFSRRSSVQAQPYARWHHQCMWATEHRATGLVR